MTFKLCDLLNVMKNTKSSRRRSSCSSSSAECWCTCLYAVRWSCWKERGLSVLQQTDSVIKMRVCSWPVKGRGGKHVKTNRDEVETAACFSKCGLWHSNVLLDLMTTFLIVSFTLSWKLASVLSDRRRHFSDFSSSVFSSLPLPRNML